MRVFVLGGFGAETRLDRLWQKEDYDFMINLH
jgi:hypothetical protein